MNTIIDLLLSLFLLTSSPWLWLVVGIAAISAIGVGISAKGLSNAKKGEAAQQARKKAAQEAADRERAEAAQQAAKAKEEKETVAEEQTEAIKEPVAEEVEENVAEETTEEVAEEIAEETEEAPVEEEVEESESVEEVAEETTEETEEAPVEEVAETSEEEEEVSEAPEEVQESAEEISEEEAPEESEEETVSIAAETIPETAVAVASDDNLDISVDHESGTVYYNGYRRSFESKLIQSNDRYKDYYSQIKNKLLSYKKIHARMSWSCESFRLGRKLLSKVAFRGRTLCLYLALDPNEYPENIYHQRNMGDKKKYAEVPMMVRVRSNLGLKRALTLIEALMEKEGVALNKKYEETDYSNIAYEPDAPLIVRNLIKIVQNKRVIIAKQGETQEEAMNRTIEEIKKEETEEEDFPISAEEAAEELEYTVDEEQQSIFYTIYRRSFESKLIQSKDAIKNYYSALKNELLSFKKVRARTSWACESFRLGRVLKAKLAYRGRTLCLYLALDPNDYPENIYHQRNMGDKKKYAEVPMMVRVKSDLGLKRAITLIQIMMANDEIERNAKYEAVDFSQRPYEADAPLLERGLIKIGKGKRSIILKDGETEEEAVKRTVEEIKAAEKEEEDDSDDKAEELQYTINEEEQLILYTVYRRSFESKLIQSKDEYKGYYSELKNELLSYKKIHSRVSWACESFRLGRVLKAKLAYRGRTLCLYLALDPKEYPENIYHQRDMSDKKKYADVPMMVRVKSNLGLKRAITLIRVLMTIDDVQPVRNFTPIDYSGIPYEADEPLIERKLIKLATGRRAFFVQEGETQEEAVKRTVEEIKSQNAEEKESFVEGEESEAAPATAEAVEEVPEFAEAQESVEAPAEVAEEAAPEFAEQTTEEVAPETAQAEEETFAFAEGETKEIAPEAAETIEEIPEFAEAQENVEAPAEMAEEAAPEFALGSEIEEAPEAAEAIEEVPDFAEQTTEEVAPETAQAEEETFAFAEGETKEIAPEAAQLQEEAPEFEAVQENENVPEAFIAVESDAPDFAEAQAGESFAPKAVEDEVPDFVAQEASDEFAPDKVEAAAEDAPEFAGAESTSDAPEAFTAISEETPEFAGAENSEMAAPETVTDGLAVPEFASQEEGSDAAPEAVVAPDEATFAFAGEQTDNEAMPEAFNAPEGSFVPDFNAPEGGVDDSRHDKLISPEAAFLSFVSPDSEMNDMPTRLDVISESGPVMPKEILEDNLAGISDDYFGAAPTRLAGEEGGDETAPTVVVIAPTQDLFGRPLPKGLFDEVPYKAKKKEQTKEPEVKREIPTGELSPEDAKMVADSQAALDALIEEEASETTINEEDEANYNIVGTCEDTSAFTAFENKLLGANNKTKYIYSEIKNAIMSYKFVKCKTSNAGDSFRQGNNLIARITFNNNKLRLHLCLNPKAYSVKIYNHYSLKTVTAYQEVPFTLELLSRKDLINATKLVQDAMASKFVIELDKKREYVDYAAMYTMKSEQ